MRHFLLPILLVALALPLLLAAGAQAATDWGQRVGDPGFGTPAIAVARVELAAYVADVAPIYTRLHDCSCCCETVDLPSHRCAACAASAARIRQVVARVDRVQRQLADVSVPASLATANRELVLAASTMHTSGAYMARTVSADPQALVTATFASPPRGRGGVVIVYRASPKIVAAARWDAVARHAPKGTTSAYWLSSHRDGVARTIAYAGTPGQVAQHYLAVWRTLIVSRAAAAGMTLPAAFTD